MADQWLTADEQRAWRAYMHATTALTARLNRQLQAESGLSLPGVRGTRAAQRGAWRQAPPVPARPRPGLGAEQALAPAIPHDPPRVRHQAGLSRRPAGRTGGADQAGPGGDRVCGARARGRRPAPGLRPDRQHAGGGVRAGVQGHPSRAGGRRRAVITAGARAPSSSSRRSAASILPSTLPAGRLGLASRCARRWHPAGQVGRFQPQATDGKATPRRCRCPDCLAGPLRPV